MSQTRNRADDCWHRGALWPCRCYQSRSKKVNLPPPSRPKHTNQLSSTRYKGVTVNEVRLGLRVCIKEEDTEKDKQIYGEHLSVDPVCVGKAIAGIALSSNTNTDHPPYFLYSVQEVDEVLKNIWREDKKKPVWKRPSNTQATYHVQTV